jgi:phosphoribosyl 1,2-cyclic phosphodiesterase
VSFLPPNAVLVGLAPPGCDVRLGILGSGSGGNALVVEAGGTTVLFDCGISYRQLVTRATAAVFVPGRVGAVFLSHEHDDHVKGLEVFRRHHDVAVLATAGTAAGMASRPSLAQVLFAGRAVRVGTLEVLPVPISHDAREPVGWVVSCGAQRVGIATDTGVVTAALREPLMGCHALLLECNHDRDLLRVGPYPWPLKQRILSRTGHLSNDQAREALEGLMHGGLELVVGMHLSETNNRPAMVRAELESVFAGTGVSLAIARQDAPLVVTVGPPAPLFGQLRLFADGEPKAPRAIASRRR